MIKRDESDYKRQPCRFCTFIDAVKLRRKIASNGVNMYTWWCTECEQHASVLTFIPHKVVKGWQDSNKLKISLDEIPVVDDFSHELPCVICGQPGEYHHWAPQSLAEFFGNDWQKWPGSALCRKHHNQWHSIVTWAIPSPVKADSRIVEKYAAYVTRICR